MNFLRLFLLGVVMTTLTVVTLHAQGEPTYPNILDVRIPFYFEDGAGNRDTVIYGFNDLAVDGINSDLGEEDMRGVPFDSIFEVRIANFSRSFGPRNGIDYMGKVGYLQSIFRVTGNNTVCENRRFDRLMEFVVRIKHYPLSVTWDNSPFQPGGELECLDNSFITNSHAEAVFGRWWDLIDNNNNFVSYSCLARDNLKIFEAFDPASADAPFDPFGAYVEYPIEGSMKPETLAVFNISLYLHGSFVQPCGDLVDTDEPTDLRNQLAVFPNPTRSFLSIKVPEDLSLTEAIFEIVAMDGRSIRKNKFVSGRKIDIASLPRGPYFFRLIDQRQGKDWTTKFVKQ